MPSQAKRTDQRKALLSTPYTKTILFHRNHGLTLSGDFRFRSGSVPPSPVGARLPRAVTTHSRSLPLSQNILGFATNKGFP